MSQAISVRPEPDFEDPPRFVGKLYEVVDGNYVEPTPMGASQTRIAGILYGALWIFLRGKKLGDVDNEMLFLLREDPRLERRPDVSYISYERWPAEKPVPETGAWDVIPDLAVEVVSPSNTASEILDKVIEYFEAGVRRVWVVFPRRRIIHDYASPDEIRVLRGDAALDGGEIVPGFSIALAELFARV